MSTNTMYALSIDEIVNAIAVQVPLPPEDKTTIIVEGEMGSGKSSILKELDAKLSDHKAIYFDCTTKADAGDLMLPKFKDLDGNDYVTFATNEELGMHLKDTPLIIMIDEAGKNRAIQNPLNRLFQERMIGMHSLHPESVVFATTNLGFENVGDMFMPHTCNRVSFVRMRKPNALEWIEHMINIDGDAVTLAFVKDNPQVLASSDDVKDPEDNVYINHPKAVGRRSFCTPRSLHKASNYMKMRDKLTDKTLTALLIGTIGARGAMDMMAHLKLAAQLPTLESIKTDPKNAKVPTTAAAICMVVFRTLAAIEQDWLNAWMTYMERLDVEAQGMFANGVRSPKYSKQSMVMQNRRFTQWAADNSYMFSSDQT
jgi:hypothetical protein